MRAGQVVFASGTRVGIAADALPHSISSGRAVKRIHAPGPAWAWGLHWSANWSNCTVAALPPRARGREGK